MAEFDKWLQAAADSTTPGKLLENSDTEIKGRINSVYEKQSNKARAKTGNKQTAKARAVSKKKVAKKKVASKK